MSDILNTTVLLQGILANCLTEVLLSYGRFLVGSLPGLRSTKSLLQEQLGENRSISQLIQTTLGRLALIQGRRSSDELAQFLGGIEVETTVRELFLLQSGNRVKPSSHRNSVRTLSSVREAFVYSYLHWKNDFAEPSHAEALELFELVLHSLTTALDYAISQKQLFALDMKNELRFRQLADHIEQSIDNKLSILREVTDHPVKYSEAAIQHFRAQLTTRLSQKYSYVAVPTLDSISRISFNQVFVLPTIISLSDSSEAELELILDAKPRTVILGDPGSGKSTLCQKLILKELEADREPWRLPLIIVLRELALPSGRKELSFLKYIQSILSSKLELEVSTELLSYLLAQGRFLLVFDGLDELTKSTMREEVRDSIEVFASAYPLNRFVITSREVGYENAPLNARVYDLLQIQPFELPQVKEYANNWLDVHTESSSAEKQRTVDRFLKQSEHVLDLRHNPLLLGLMLDLFDSTGFIPDSRPELYEKCALLLYERLEFRKEIPVPFRYERDMKPALAYLAYNIYSKQHLQAGIRESELINLTAQYFYNRKEESLDEARQLAHDFISFCKGRAWVFTDVSSTKRESMYQFTHRTFLEYFTALYLLRTHPDPNKLFQEIKPRIQKKEWVFPSQLALQLMANSFEESLDKLLLELVSEGERMGAEWGTNLLEFAIQVVDVTLASPSVVRLVVRQCTVRYCEELEHDLTNSGEPSGDGRATLLSYSSRDAKRAGIAADECLKTLLRHSKKSLSSMRTSLLVSLAIVSLRRAHGIYEDGAFEQRFSNGFEQVLAQDKGLAERCFSIHRDLGGLAVVRQRWPLAVYLKAHGFSALQKRVAVVLAGLQWPSPAEAIARELMQYRAAGVSEAELLRCEEMAHALVEYLSARAKFEKEELPSYQSLLGLFAGDVGEPTKRRRDSEVLASLIGLVGPMIMGDINFNPEALALRWPEIVELGRTKRTIAAIADYCEKFSLPTWTQRLLTQE